MNLEIPSPWGCFDAIFCINLASRPDRRREAEAQFAKVGLTDRVRFYTVEKDVENPERGIFTSHMQVIRKGLAEGARHILIFEDDICFRRWRPERLAAAMEFLDGGTGLAGAWDVFFLGGLVKSSGATAAPAVRKIRYQGITHALALNRDCAEIVAAHNWHGVPMDDFYRDRPELRVYALYPFIAFQSPSPSDNDPWLGLDRFRRLLGGLTRIQIFNEWICRYRLILLIAHIAAALAGIMLFFQ
ncbi:MAG: glycosyltransferase [Desulfobacterales bacterium]|nr:MAG: glycosyltransferase [Desulfobacterales bacterium]